MHRVVLAFSFSNSQCPLCFSHGPLSQLVELFSVCTCLAQTSLVGFHRVTNHVDSLRCDMTQGSGVGSLTPSREWQAHLHWEGQAFSLKSIITKTLQQLKGNYIHNPTTQNSYLCFLCVFPLSLFLFVYNHYTCKISCSTYSPVNIIL